MWSIDGCFFRNTNGIPHIPGYFYLHRNGLLRRRAELMWDLSHKGSGRDYEVEGLAGMMLQLQKEGCQNIKIQPSFQQGSQFNSFSPGKDLQIPSKMDISWSYVIQ